MEELFSDIVIQLESLADPKIAVRKKQMWHKKPGYRSYGIRTQETRELIKGYLSHFKRLRIIERFMLARRFYKSGISEQVGFGEAILELSVNDLTPDKFDLLDEIVSYVNNWAATDWFCIRVLQPLLRKHPKEILSLLRGWNISENMWKRRASVVAFTRKIGASGDFTDEALCLCDNLIWDEEDLVRKGVGWALKDNMRADKKRVLEYVKSLRRKGVSSTITLYAIRDLKGVEREEVLSIKRSKAHAIKPDHEIE